MTLLTRLRQRRPALIILSLAVLLALAGCARPYQYHGLLLDSPKPAADFTLTGADGQPVSLSDLRGKLTVLYFGYTYCPDVCPTTLSDVAKAMKELGSKAEDVQFVMVSVDPERDTPERLNEYVTYFDPRFVGLTGSPEEVAAAATPFGIFYQKHEGTAATGYLVDHTATLTVIDEEGRVRLVLPFGTAFQDIADDLAHLLK
jgi:protein SCO1/2